MCEKFLVGKTTSDFLEDKITGYFFNYIEVLFFWTNALTTSSLHSRYGPCM